MPQADIVGHDGANLCRCRGCKQIFRAGGDAGWHNHFWCRDCIHIPQAELQERLRREEEDDG